MTTTSETKMEQVAIALQKFYSGFDLPAFPVNGVPENVQEPYITYNVPVVAGLDPATHYIQVFYRDKSYVSLARKTDEIIAAIGSGILLGAGEDGYICIRTENPTVQLLQDDDENKRAYINAQINTWL